MLISNLICSFQVEDEMERMMENAHEKFVSPLDTFRKEQIGSVKKTKKDFEGGFATTQICSSTKRPFEGEVFKGDSYPL